LADTLAATNTRKQSAVTFEVLVLWVRNQFYHTRDVIGIKMMHRNLPYYKGIWDKTRREYKLHENKPENHANHLHTFRKWSITWYQFVLSTRSKHWLIPHSMACTAIHNSRDSDKIKYGGPSQDCGSMKKTSRASYQVSLCCYSDYLTFFL